MVQVNETERKRVYRTRVRWTEEEFQTFIAEACKYGTPEVGDTPEVFRLAMQALPENRRRPHDPALAGKMNTARRKGGVYKGTMQAERVAPPPSPQQAPEAVPAPPSTAPSAPVDRAVAPTPTLDGDIVPEAVFDTLATAVSNKVASVIKDSLLQVLYDPQIRLALREIVADMITPETDLQQEQSIVWRQPKTPKERLPRIVIAGGMVSLKETFKDFKYADLRFWGQSRHEHRERLKGLLKGADLAVVMSDHISHGAVETIRWTKVNFIYWSHSYPDLRVELQRIAPTLLTENAAS